MTLSERDAALIWHPYTQMHTAPMPTGIVKGEGAYLYDEEGKRYIDAISSWWVTLHGHSHPYIAKKLYEQALTLEHSIFAGFTHRPAVELAERLIKHLPDNQKRLFYSDNGSTAVEVALKMAFQYWHNKGEKRTKIIAFNDAYHGDTFGAMSVSGRSAFTAPFLPFLFDVVYIDIPKEGNEEHTHKQLSAALDHGNVAAFIFEPLVQGAGGMNMYAPSALNKLIKLCKEHQVLCIADEVMTGFGRTGKFFATDHLSEKPDMMCLSKGLTGGTMALGITTATNAVYEAFLSEDKMKTLFHGHSFTANPLACTVALASLDLMEQTETWQSIQHIVQRHSIFLSEIKDYPAIENARQRGTILALTIKTTQQTSYFNNLRDEMYNYFIEKGILLRPLGNVLYILPPYCISDADLDYVYTSIKEFLNR